MLALLLAVLLGTAGHPLSVVDTAGTPVGGATVTFVDASGARDVEHADTAGSASARPGFTPVTARIEAPGYSAVTVTLDRAAVRVVLEHPLETIGNVRVATGSLQSLHALPVAATVLDRAAIANTAAATSDDVLRTLPGFDRTRSNSAFTNYGQLRLSFAGAGTDRGLVLVDGVPAQDGFGGQVDWVAYPATSLVRAELLEGAGSALYGAGAVGGVLDLRTFGPAAASSDVPDGTLIFAAGSHACSTQSVDARAAIGRRVTASFSASQQSLGYADFPPSFQSNVDHLAQSENAATALRVRDDLGNGSALEAQTRAAWDYQDQGRSNYRYWRRWNQDDVHFTHASAQGFFDSLFFVRNAVVTNIDDQFPTAPGILRFTQSIPTTESGASAAWSASGSNETFQARADLRWIRGSTQQLGPGDAFQNAAGGEQHTGGLAFQETLRDTSNELIFGVRADTVSYVDGSTATPSSILLVPARTEGAISPRIALRHDLSHNVAIRISSGAGFRPPYLNELLRGFFIGSVQEEPNASLVPERSTSTSAGVDWVNGVSRVSLDAFHTNVHDAIAFRTIDSTHQIRSNFDRTQTDGATLTFARAIGTCARLSLSATAQHPRVTAGDSATLGKLLPFVAESSATLAYDGRAGSADVGISATYSGQTYADDVNSEPLGAATVVGAHVRVPLKDGAAIVLSAQNLTDAHYLSSADRVGQPTILSLAFALPIGPEHRTTNACSF